MPGDCQITSWRAAPVPKEEYEANNRKKYAYSQERQRGENRQGSWQVHGSASGGGAAGRSDHHEDRCKNLFRGLTESDLCHGSSIHGFGAEHNRGAHENVQRSVFADRRSVRSHISPYVSFNTNYPAFRKVLNRAEG